MSSPSGDISLLEGKRALDTDNDCFKWVSGTLYYCLEGCWYREISEDYKQPELLADKANYI
jgi:hypothetical protein